MRRLRFNVLLAAAIFTAACVTINVYFPAAQAEKAADRIISDVWGQDSAPRDSVPPDEEPQGRLQSPDGPFAPVTMIRLAATGLLDIVVPRAEAQDIEIETPEIRALTGSMSARHQKLKPYYEAGAIGLTADGLLAIRDRNQVPLAERNTLRQLVEAENRDRNDLYRAIAEANDKPEWEDDIRDTFAQRWIDRASEGWWYRTAPGNWQQK
ncbi:YdbL family protein [Wenzhouxiangella sp. XN24]|uniref:YdbL family protein n=1 Tax=Wenzhouxiangella sp. XN24 TaxID=2713569 RepID=UPI0013E9C815|nr:YdbL family protein [Wenzhouxiangella sp. XN24]NGX15566.1 YdbL family protein [Wenzhouxiangella sp. XN24]